MPAEASGVILFRCENERGVQLYEKMGFKIEGKREMAAFIDGRFQDEYYIAFVC